MTFRKLFYHRKCKRRGVGGKKKANLVNVDCERPLMGSMQVFPVVGNTCDIYRLRGNPIIIIEFPRNLSILQGISTTYIGFLYDSYSSLVQVFLAAAP